MTTKFVKDLVGDYIVTGPLSEEDILAQASAIIDGRFKKGAQITAPADSKQLFINKLATSEREVFAVLYLDTRHYILGYEELFYGTIDSASVYPREIIKKGLEFNAAALVISHNHPSGEASASKSDNQITKAVKDSCAIMGMRLLDHIIVGGSTVYSFAEHGLM